jgi:hypothetical protein
MAGVAYVASAIACFVAVEVVELLLSASRQRSVVPVMRVKAVVNVAVKSARTMEPGTSSKKHPAYKPVRAVVAIRRAVIGSIVEVPIGANRRHSDVDSNLGWPQGWRA